MAETAEQIRFRIDQTRDRLGKDLNALEYRVKQETDWRIYFNRNPWAFVGAAYGFALLVGMAFGSRRS
jgi:hypothetical protein